jgi:hypothetical protein
MWVKYFSWCLVVGLSAGYGLAEQSIPALVIEFIAAWYAVSYRRMAMKGVMK